MSTDGESDGVMRMVAFCRQREREREQQSHCRGSITQRDSSVKQYCDTITNIQVDKEKKRKKERGGT